MHCRFKPWLLLWSLTVRCLTLSLIWALMMVWMDRDGLTFNDLYDRALGNDSFCGTDYFAVISHYVFLQVLTICTRDYITVQNVTL